MISSNQHVHHWLIEESNGQHISKGACACGAVRDFENWGDERRALARPPMLVGSSLRKFPRKNRTYSNTAPKPKRKYNKWGCSDQYPEIIAMIRKSG